MPEIGPPAHTAQTPSKKQANKAQIASKIQADTAQIASKIQTHTNQSPQVPARGNTKWYVSFEKNTCVQNCVGYAACGGTVEGWEILYDTPALCCHGQLWWIDRERCVDNSLGV